MIVGLAAILGGAWLVTRQPDPEPVRQREPTAAEWAEATRRVDEEARRALATTTPKQHIEAAWRALGPPDAGLEGVLTAEFHLSHVPADAGAVARQADAVRQAIAQRRAAVEEAERARERERFGGGPGWWPGSRSRRRW